ncbi:MAG: AtpZ/AtpI family protein [Tyzzerella sp.]|nr:AtpZ/AtpI family protein [Tyzzerella sp.]
MKNKKSVYTTFALISQLGISMVAPILLCTYAGVWLEGKFSIPLTIPLMILGVFSGARNVYAMVRRAIEEAKEEEDEEE